MLEDCTKFHRVEIVPNLERVVFYLCCVPSAVIFISITENNKHTMHIETQTDKYQRSWKNDVCSLLQGFMQGLRTSTTKWEDGFNTVFNITGILQKWLKETRQLMDCDTFQSKEMNIHVYLWKWKGKSKQMEMFISKRQKYNGAKFSSGWVSLKFNYRATNYHQGRRATTAL